MKVKSDDLKRLYQESIKQKTSADRKDCPSPEYLTNIIIPSAHFKNRRKLVDHISECSHCSGELRYILDAYEKGEVLSDRLTLDRQNSFFGAVRSLLLGEPASLFIYSFALLGIVIMAVSITLIVQQADTRIELRSPSRSFELRSPIGDIWSSRPLLFEWKGLPEADSYHMELFDEELLPVWSSPELRDCRILLPEDVACLLLPEKAYYWMVTAFSLREKIAESNLVYFILRD